MEIRTRRTCFHLSSPHVITGTPPMEFRLLHARRHASMPPNPPEPPVREAGSSWPVGRYGARDQNVHRSLKTYPHLSWQPRRRGATRSNRICSWKVIPRAGDRGHVWSLNPNGCRSTKSKHEANRSIEVFMSTGIDDGAGSKGGLDGLRFARPHANAGGAFVRRWGVGIGPRSRPTEGLWQELPADLSGPQVGRSPLQTLPSLART